MIKLNYLLNQSLFFGPMYICLVFESKTNKTDETHAHSWPSNQRHIIWR